MHIIGKFTDPSQVGGLVDTLKNIGIQRRDMIISSFDEQKFEKMEEAVESKLPNIMSDQDAPGELEAFVQNIKGLEDDNGIVVSVKTARHKMQEVKSVMEQSGAFEIVLDD